MQGTNYNIDELIANESFRRWLQGKASGQEKSYWDILFRDDSQPEQAHIDEMVRNEVATDYGERKTINLSEGSVDNTGLDVITSALSNTLDTPIEVTSRAVYIGGEYSNKGL